VSGQLSCPCTKCSGQVHCGCGDLLHPSLHCRASGWHLHPQVLHHLAEAWVEHLVLAATWTLHSTRRQSEVL
jgi:hypothetical protein